MARVIQSGMIGRDVQCLYCKYSFDCAKKFKKTRKMLFVDILNRMKKTTGVNIFLDPGTKESDILSSSWIEKHPVLLKKFTSMSFEEQLDNLKNPDILRYADN